MVMAALACFPVESVADIYEVKEIKGGRLLKGKTPLNVGARFNDKDNVDAIWDKNVSFTPYIKIFNVTTNVAGVIMPSTKTTRKKEPSLWDRILDYFTERKKCSTRSEGGIAEKELSDKLSQTFYLLRNENEKIDIATALPLDPEHYLQASYLHPSTGKKCKVRFNNRNGLATLSVDDLKDLPHDESHMVLRLSVEYVNEANKSRLQLTPCMNLILIEP